MTPQEQGKEKPLLPGCGRPLNHTPTQRDLDYVGDLFPNALSDVNMRHGAVGLSALTVREIRMLQFMNRVTDKSEWFIKVNDEDIAKKWKDEICSNFELDFTPKMADWCIAELRYIASFHSASPENPPIVIFQGDVVKSDTSVSIELKHALQEAVKRFQEAIPEKLKDWHPGSDTKVLDLVHPSLYPLVYGRTRILCDGETTTLDNCIERCGQGEIMDVPPDEQTTERDSGLHGNMKVFSNKFQWLPCEVNISGERAKITSYINNLHPKKERGLYELIERLIDAAIPLWNVTLAPLADKSFCHQLRINYTAVEYDPSTFPEPQQKLGEDTYDYLDRKEEWIQINRRLVYPEPEGVFQPRQLPPFLDLKTKYGKSGLQVIVKLANIQLTPEKPNYEGGSWHVEGQLNEHIVSTALYYYSSENITTSTLGFRQICRTEDVEEEVAYEQNDDDWLADIFGCKNWSGAIQDVGSVETREGRLITFPNVLQHRVAPFKLADPTKPGHRKIVALFLVDPNIKITSTAHVPCQQQEWWWETAMATQIPRIPKLDSGVSKIPIELQDGILEGVDFPIGLAEAKALRLELMEERKSFTIDHGKAFEDAIQFSLCEH